MLDVHLYNDIRDSCGSATQDTMLVQIFCYLYLRRCKILHISGKYDTLDEFNLQTIHSILAYQLIIESGTRIGSYDLSAASPSMNCCTAVTVSVAVCKQGTCPLASHCRCCRSSASR